MLKLEYTITVYTENQIGIISRVSTIFSRRKINIESLNTSPSEIEGIHRFTIVIHETEDVVKKLVRQIEKQVDILRAFYNTDNELELVIAEMKKIGESESYREHEAAGAAF